MYAKVGHKSALKRAELYVFSRARTVPKAIRLDDRFQIHHITNPEEWPPTCDYYVIGTGYTWRAELAAARMRATAVVLPEQGEWLHGKILTALSENRDVWAYMSARGGDTPWS